MVKKLMKRLSYLLANELLLFTTV